MKRYPLILATLFAVVLHAYANDTLQREVTIVRNFTPVVRDAEKINTLPPITTPTFDRKPSSYAFDAYTADVTAQASRVDLPHIIPNGECEQSQK